MKKRNLLLSGLFAAAMLVTSCTKNELTPPVVEGAPASLTISIAGEKSKTRAVDSSPMILEESKINDYKVFVINAPTGIIQSIHSFGSGLTVNLTGLTSGDKRLVVVANTDAVALMLPEVGDHETVFENPGNKLDIQDQTYDKMKTDGFVMSGERFVTLTAGENTLSGSILISRVVAKVRLGSVTITPNPGHDGDFQLKNVFIMRGKKQATYGPNNIFTDPYFIGGMVATQTMFQTPSLMEAITNSDNTGRLFYVFPNEGGNNEETLLVVEGTYNGDTRFFPIRINDNSGLPGSTSDGSLIRRNGQYTVNMTIKRPNDGSLNPEVPVDPAVLDLSIEVEDWATELVQNVEI